MIDNYHADAVRSFRSYKKLAERAMEQVSDAEFFASIDDEANSIAVLVKHIAGNAVSRWRDFLTTDGEKPGRLGGRHPRVVNGILGNGLENPARQRRTAKFGRF